MLTLTPYAFDSPARLLLMPDPTRDEIAHADPDGFGFCSIAQALGTLGAGWTRREKFEKCLPGDEHGRVLENGRGLWVARLER